VLDLPTETLFTELQQLDCMISQQTPTLSKPTKTTKSAETLNPKNKKSEPSSRQGADKKQK
jgi:hypothetical protein